MVFMETADSAFGLRQLTRSPLLKGFIANSYPGSFIRGKKGLGTRLVSIYVQPKTHKGIILPQEDTLFG